MKTFFSRLRPSHVQTNASKQPTFPEKVLSEPLQDSTITNKKVTFDAHASPPTPNEHEQGYLPTAESWSAMAETDLLMNLGPRERTRQEVLWEIVSSEERYVAELVKLNDTFIAALLPAQASSPSLSHPLEPSFGRAMSPTSLASPGSPIESVSSLPIAARFSRRSETPQGASDLGLGIQEEDETGNREKPLPAPPGQGVTPRMRAYHQLTHGRPNAPSPTNSASKRSHHSLPPLPRPHQGVQPTSFSASHASRSSHHADASRKASGSSHGTHAEEHHLPADLEKVLDVLGNGILKGHMALSAALRRRYEAQYPLVRSLADVFIAHSYILREYATYVLHLENALAQADEAFAACEDSHQGQSKRASKRLEATAVAKLGRTLMHLEEIASEKGESGLVISLSKPFQRLLKYPLLFQNLLFNTDPSTKEYEATLAMVDEVEQIVRSIEDKKTTSEEREKTRDVIARIDGLEKDRMLIAPKPSRLLIEEHPLVEDSSSYMEQKGLAGKQKKSFRRLSDIIKGDGDLWVVRFTDVSLICARTGVTSLPLSTYSRSTSSQDLSSRKPATVNRRSQQMKPRNLYKFVRVEGWKLEQAVRTQEAVLSMEDISRSRNQPAIRALPAVRPQPLRAHTATTATTDNADNQSVMSFAVRGNDQLRPNRAARASLPPPATRSLARPASAVPPTVRDQSAKFAHRLRSPDITSSASLRPTTRSIVPPPRAATASPNRAAAPRPPWGSSAAARAPKTTATATARNAAVRSKHLSPSPSEDSGVAGLHRMQADGDARPKASGRAPGARI